MWEHVDLRELRTFLMLCEELHFGRAAERLGVSQGRVTQVIKQLETKLGGPLFERSSRRVRITPSGESLRAGLGPALAELERTVRDADRTGPTVSGELRIGVVVAVSGGPLLPTISERFHREHPACTCSIVDVPMRDGLPALRRGDVELMAIRLPIEQPDITVGPVLTRDRRALAVALHHPLATRDSIRLDDVVGYRVADVSAFLPPEMVHDFFPSHTSSGQPLLRTVFPDGDPAGVLTAVVRGEVVHLTVTTLKDYVNHPGFTLVPIDDMPPSSTGLVWLTARASSAVRAFTSIAQAVLDEAGRRAQLTEAHNAARNAARNEAGEH